MTQTKASARYVRVAPNKARQVVAHIRGLDVGEARRVLAFSPKEVSTQILKTLDSAVANAEHNDNLDPEDLFITSVIVDEGPTLKRFQPRAMGRAYRIRKRTSHITITVGDTDPEGRVLRGPQATQGTTTGRAGRRGRRGRPGRGAKKEQ